MLTAPRHMHCPPVTTALFGAFLLAVVLVLPGGALAQKTVTVVFENYPPYEFMEQETAKGINVAIIREAFRRMNVTPVFKTMPWKRGLHELKNGTVAALASGFKSRGRESFAIFPRHHLSIEINAIFTRTNDTLEVKSMRDLDGKIVGVVREYLYGREFDNYTGILKDPVNANPLLVMKLIDRRVDAIAGNLRVITTLAEQLEMGHLIRPVYHFSKVPLHIFFSKIRGRETEELARSFDVAMESMQADGTLARLRSRK